MTDLACASVSVGFGRQAPVLDKLDLCFRPDEVTALVGPNGSGKSTLLLASARIHLPRAGAVLLDGRDLQRLSTREIARRLALLPQSSAVPDDLCVRDLVSYGRYPHVSRFAGLSDTDHAAIAEAIDRTALTPFVNRAVNTLSGGERQRVWVACALAQQTKWLLLDEPTTYLDLGHQVSLMRLLRSLHDRDGLGLVMALHDLSQAATYADRIVVLHRGSVVADGTPKEVITPTMLQEVFGTEADVVAHPRTGQPLVIAAP